MLYQNINYTVSRLQYLRHISVILNQQYCQYKHVSLTYMLEKEPANI